MKVNNNHTVWMEKYRPQQTTDLILPPNIKVKFEQYAKNEDIPNLGLWSSSPGTGKTSTATALIKEINGEALFINASMDNGIDLLRSKITSFASTEAFDGKLKIVVLDECLEENEEVRIGTLDKWEPIKLNTLVKGEIYNCVSFNMGLGKFENDTCEIISDKLDDIYEVELEDGRVIKVTANHPFIINENGKFIEKSINDGLSNKDDIVCIS